MFRRKRRDARRIRVDGGCRKIAAFTAAVLFALYFAGPEKSFSQSPPDSRNRNSFGHGSRILEYQFDRADRELSPGKWMEEAGRGIMTAKAALAEMAPEIFFDPEAQKAFAEWSEEELERRYTRWILERFFGAGAPLSSVLRETGEADKRLIYHIGEDGNILYDPGTGDPRIIRPGEEGRDFAEDLASWKRETRAALEREMRDYGTGVKEKYPELLKYISPERGAEFERKLAAAGDAAIQSFKFEFEAVLAREERRFTARRLGDVWSLRKKNEDKAADAVGGKLIEEARRTCDASVVALEAKIEAARTDEGNLALAGAQWLDEYREQFNRGLEAWESAEEQFLFRRVEWEQSAAKSFYEGGETWSATFARFEEEKRNWEERARILFLEGERFFSKTSESMEAAIAAAKSEYEKGARRRIEAVSEKTGALAGMYALSASAAEEARKNIDFWLGKYGDLNTGAGIPGDGADLEAWIDAELLNWDGGGLGPMILDELKTWSGLRRDYAAKEKESLGLLTEELESLKGAGDKAGLSAVFNPDPYEAELIRAGTELDYWENRVAVAEAVAAYAEALDAGRTTAAESLDAWTKAKAAYDEAAALSGAAEDALKAKGVETAAARDAMAQASERMRAAEASLEKLRRHYRDLAAALGSGGNAIIAEELAYSQKELETEERLLSGIEGNSPWGKYLSAARELDAAQANELRKEILKQLIAGDDGSQEDQEPLESLADLARKARAGAFEEGPLFSFAETLWKENKIDAPRRDSLFDALRNSSRAMAECQLNQRLAALGLIIENADLADWYSFARKIDGTEISVPRGANVEGLLLRDWENSQLDLLIAKAELEIAALRFLEGEESGEAAAVLAALYTGDEMAMRRDRENLERISASLYSIAAARKENGSYGDLNDLLVEAAAEDPGLLSFLTDGGFSGFQRGREIADSFLHEFIRKEEYGGALLDMYAGSGELSSPVARQNVERGFSQLKKLWETLGIETGNSFLPQAARISRALEESGSAENGAYSLFAVLDELFDSFPSWLELNFNTWKESLFKYCAAPDQTALFNAERQTDLFNAALSLLKKETAATQKSDFDLEVERRLSDPLGEFDESVFEPVAVSDDNCESAIEELRNHYFREKNYKEEIDRLIFLLELSTQKMEDAGGEAEKTSAEILLAEKEFGELQAAYKEAAENFKKAGEAFDAFYDKTDAAYENLEAARRDFEIQDAVKLWADTAYLDSRRPEEELRLCRERSGRARNAFESLRSLKRNSGRRKNGEYDNAYESYKESLSLLTLSLAAERHLERAVEAEKEKTQNAYRVYQEQLSLLGKRFSMEDAYVSPEEKSQWGVKDIISVDGDGFLAFSRNGGFSLSGADAERARNLNQYFTPCIFVANEPNPVSAFELALRGLSERLPARLRDSRAYQTLGLARDYLIRGMIRENQDLSEISAWYRTAEPLTRGNNLGDMVIPLTGDDLRVHEMMSRSGLAKVADAQSAAWDSLSPDARRDLEFYTILTLLGGGGKNAEYLSRASECREYEQALIYINPKYKSLKKKANIPLVGLFFKNNYKKIRAVRNALMSPRNELGDMLVQGYEGLNDALVSLNQKLGSYKESADRLALVSGTSFRTVNWEDIERALYAVEGFNADAGALRTVWEKISEKPGTEVYDALSALKLIAGACGNLMDENLQKFNRIWDASETERAANEAGYREMYRAYLVGQKELIEVKEAASLSYRRSSISEKSHLENSGSALMETLYGFTEQGMGGTDTGVEMAETYSGVIAAIWEKMYMAELAVRETEWDMRRRDVAEKFSLWRESASIILERGRSAWKEGEEKLNEAGSQWARSYQEEYGRISDAWTAAYLEGLRDKETWAAGALDAAERASSSALRALIGSDAEAGARAMATRDPLGANSGVLTNASDMREGERLLAELIEKSGAGSLAAAFSSIAGSREDPRPLIRSGSGGRGMWDSGTALVEASALARSVREEFETRESRKMAFAVAHNAMNAFDALKKNVAAANGDFRKSMDETFIIDGQWRRGGPGYVKKVIVHSTFLDSVITESAKVEGYRDYLFPATRLSEYFNEGLIQNMNPFQAETMTDSVYSELEELQKRIFGSREEGGEFSIHIGDQPVIKSGYDLGKGRNGIIEVPGTGELGRLLTEFYFWMLKEKAGVAAVAMAPWEKPLWDSRGSAFNAPTLRSAVDVTVKAGALIVGAVASPFTGGGSLIGAVALTAALNSMDDLCFAALDVSGGYKSWKEAGTEFGKQVLVNAVEAAASKVFYGVSGSGSSFLSSGGISGLVSNSGVGGVAALGLNTAVSGVHAFSSSAAAGLINSVTYDDERGFGFSRDSFGQSVRAGAVSGVSGMAGTFARGVMDLGLNGFTGSVYSDGRALSGVVGSAASQGANYAMGDDFTLNLFNAGSFAGKGVNVNAGLLELRLGRGGPRFELGSGGADASIGTLVNAARGFEAWKTNAALLFSEEEAAMKYASQMRTLYSGTEENRREYENILAGRTVVEETGRSETESVYNAETGVKTIYLGTGALNEGGRFGLNAVFSHESYRDGMYSGEEGQAAELDAAVSGHARIVMGLVSAYGATSVNEYMIKEALAYELALNGDARLAAEILEQYDNSKDYWKLVKKDDGAWGWIDDRSADFDIRELLNDKDFQKRRWLGGSALISEMVASGIQDGKGMGIISAGRMTEDLARDLQMAVTPRIYYSGRVYSNGGLQEIVAWNRDVQTAGRALARDTLDKIAYNEAHTVTVFDDRRRPVTLHTMDGENYAAGELPKQHADSLGHIPFMSKSGCNFMDIIAVPQLLTKQTFSAQQIMELWNTAIRTGIMDMEGFVEDRNRLADMALQKLEINNIGIVFGETKNTKAKSVGYRVELPYGKGSHFVLAGTDKSLIYNPGYTYTSDQSKWRETLEVSVYGK